MAQARIQKGPQGGATQLKLPTYRRETDVLPIFPAARLTHPSPPPPLDPRLGSVIEVNRAAG